MLRDHGALVAYLHAQAKVPFSWSSASCVHLAAGAVQAQTGRDIMAELPRWKTERGAKLQLARLGGLEAAADSLLRRIPPAMAQRGDIAGVRDPDGELFLMVVEGDTLAGVHASGARRARRRHMVMAWSAD